MPAPHPPTHLPGTWLRLGGATRLHNAPRVGGGNAGLAAPCPGMSHEQAPGTSAAGRGGGWSHGEGKGGETGSCRGGPPMACHRSTLCGGLRDTLVPVCWQGGSQETGTGTLLLSIEYFIYIYNIYIYNIYIKITFLFTKKNNSTTGQGTELISQARAHAARRRGRGPSQTPFWGAPVPQVGLSPESSSGWCGWGWARHAGPAAGCLLRIQRSSLGPRCHRLRWGR